MKIQSRLITLCLVPSLGLALGGTGCDTTSSDGASGGSANVGGKSSMGGSSAPDTGSSKAGSSTNVGGTTGNGGTTGTRSATSSGGQATGGSSQGTGGTNKATGGSRTSSGGSAPIGGSAGTGGTMSAGGTSVGTGGATTLGGTTSVKSASGGSTVGGTSTSSAGGVGGVGGVTGIGGSTGGSSSAEFYFLPPPDQCHDLDVMPWTDDPTKGCVEGNPASQCGGKCKTASVCEDTSSKPNADVEYMCPRNLLFSKEMEQAVIDDGFEGFHYAVVGHDPDRGGIDGNAHTCCQCYQLVFAYPSPTQDRQAQVNPDNPNPPASAIPIPPPLIVQSFNTAATATTFDIYMPAGGMGANNGCYPMSGGPPSGSGKYMYTSYPLDGQPGQGGVKPASLYQECKTQYSWVTTESLSTQACIDRTTAACDKIASNIPGLTELSSTNCLKANTIDTFYHLNWSVYAMRVECPEHLTRVTGCKLAPQGLKAPKKDVTTAAQAAKDPDFWSKTANSNNLYETTTMEDCCRPTCASYSQISNFGLVTDPQYRSFYNCDVNGVPWTQP